MFQSYFKNARISGIIGMLSYVGLFLFIPFVGKIVSKIGKKEAITIGACVSVLAYILMFILPITPDGKGLALFVVCQLLNAIGGGIGQCVSWSLMADAMDYEEWKFGTPTKAPPMRCTPSSASWRRALDRLLALWLPHGWVTTLPWVQTRPSRLLPICAI